MRKFLFVCILALLCGCEAKEPVLLPPMEEVAPVIEQEEPPAATGTQETSSQRASEAAPQKPQTPTPNVSEEKEQAQPPSVREEKAPTPSPSASEKKEQTPPQSTSEAAPKIVERSAPTVEEEVLPQPQESETVEEGTPKAETCTISISVTELMQNLDALDVDKHELIPSDGWILPPTSVELEEGESVFDLLRRVCQTHGILMEFTTSNIYQSAYIEGIANLYEFDAGPQSGWVYSVNGVTPNYGCSAFYPEAGDAVCWEYKIG